MEFKRKQEAMMCEAVKKRAAQEKKELDPVLMILQAQLEECCGDNRPLCAPGVDVLHVAWYGMCTAMCIHA